MSRITSSLETYNGICLCCKKVYHSAFAFIAPLGSNNCSYCHFDISFKY